MLKLSEVNLKKYINFIFLVFVLVFFSNISFSSPIVIKQCQEIKKPGIYILEMNLLAKENVCLTIRNQKNVVIDCQNKNFLGIKINKAILIENSSNIKLRNCIFRNFENAVILKNVDNSNFQNLMFFSVNAPFLLENVKNSKFVGSYKKEDFTFKGNNENNEYPFFDLIIFLKKYKLTLFFLFVGSFSLIMNELYERKLHKYISGELLFAISSSIILFVAGYLFFHNTRLESILYFLAFLSALSPYGYDLFKKYLIIKEYEQQFPNFVMDLSEIVKSGMPLPKAIVFLSKNDYGLLSNLIEKLAAKISWGVSLEKAWNDFAEESESELIKKVVSGLIETHKSGGDIITFLEALINNLLILNNLKKERETMMHKKTLQFYVLFFFLILTIIGISKFVLPFVEEATKKSVEMASFGNVKNLGVINASKKTFDFESLFFHLALLEAVFSSLIIGLLIDNDFKAGLKHLAILFPLTFILMKLSGF